MPDSTAHLILGAVERLAADVCGAFLVDLDGDNVGSVFVEGNRVCWAACAGMSHRLRDLLRDERDHDAADADPSAGERRALEQHTIESLAAMPSYRGERVTWIPHRNAGYLPRHTFAPVELLVAVNAIRYEDAAIGEDAALSLVDVDAPAATFVPGALGLVPTRLAGPRTTIADLDELGAWAEAAFGAARGFSRGMLARAIEAARGDMYVAWQSSRTHTHAALLDRADRVAQLVERLDARAFPTIVSRRTHNTKGDRHGDDEGSASQADGDRWMSRLLHRG
jgi:hypothetical protein|nr:hypothetical protein [Kofleriaceae bacterium]